MDSRPFIMFAKEGAPVFTHMTFDVASDGLEKSHDGQGGWAGIWVAHPEAMLDLSTRL